MSFQLQNSPLLASIATKVLSIETNDGRFEAFCRRIVSKLEGDAPVLGTSASWDMGRDGVGYGRASGLYVCVSLRDDVDGKALSDMQRLVGNARSIKQVYFCSSHELSEHRINSILETLSVEVDHAFSITVCGSAQLVEVAIANDAILNDHYGPEIEDCIRVISGPSDEALEDRGLKLALMSVGEDSASIRMEVYRSVILETLALGEATLDGLAQRISNRLHLHHVLAKEALLGPLSDLQNNNEVTFDGRLYYISDAGRKILEDGNKYASDRLFDGRAIIRSTIETSMGQVLAEDHFRRIWAVFEDRLVSYCIARGETLVYEICEMLGSTDTAKPTELRPFAFVQELADAVAVTTASSQQQIELRQAIQDIFIERTGPATEWLVQICMAYVSACSLGMEHNGGRQIERVLKKTTLILDSDVILSLLGEGEIDHQAVLAIAERWFSFGGKLLVGEPVLEECAYHASIAQLDFDQVRDSLPGTALDRQQLIDNVFVRSFAELIDKGQAELRQWPRYLSQFIGQSKYDWNPIFRMLNADYHVDRLPARSLREAGLEERVRRAIIDEGQGFATTHIKIRNLEDKARRDAQLYAALVSYMRSLRESDPNATCLLVSSARRLAAAEEHFKEAAEPELVTTISTVLNLLTLIPNVRLGANAMKAFLFDERPVGFSSQFERVLMRMLRTSEVVAMPWAKRGALMKEVRERMMKDASSRGDRANIVELEQRALTVEHMPRTITIVREAFDAAALDPKIVKENSDLKKRILELEAQVERTKHQTQLKRKKTQRQQHGE